MALAVGDPAPDFTLPATVGDKITLSGVPVARDIAKLLEKARAA